MSNLEEMIKINNSIIGFYCPDIDWRGKELTINTFFGDIIYTDKGVIYKEKEGK